MENYAKERRNDNGKYEKCTVAYGNSAITFSIYFLQFSSKEMAINIYDDCSRFNENLYEWNEWMGPSYVPIIFIHFLIEYVKIQNVTF